MPGSHRRESAWHRRQHAVRGQHFRFIFRVGEGCFIFLHESRGPESAELGEEEPLLFCVAGPGRGFCARIPVHIFAYAFMNGRVFQGQVVIVLIVGIKVLELSW